MPDTNKDGMSVKAIDEDAISARFTPLPKTPGHKKEPK